MRDCQINEELILEIGGLSSTGEGVGPFEGYAIFVEGALPGERVRVRLKERRRRYGRAELLEVLRKSPMRTLPVCPHFDRCGGCQLMHLAYEEQLVFKRRRALDALERIGRLGAVTVDPCVPSPQALHYRNKIQLPVSAENRLGLYARGTHDLIEIQRCFIHSELGERAHQAVARLLSKQKGLGFLRHVLIKTAVHTEQVLVILITHPDQGVDLSDFAKELMHRVPEVKGVVQCVNPRQDNVILGSTFCTLAGTDSIQERLGGLLFNISAASFFQVNPKQAENLYAKALSLADLSGKERVLDAFCGVGTLALQMAKRAQEVIGIECVAQAIEDARINAKQNGIGNVRFLHGHAEELIRSVGAIDMALLNPPRKGCAPSFLKELVTLSPQTIVYISCDPATLARDLKELSASHYHLASVTPFDMFPQTAHVETIVTLHNFGVRPRNCAEVNQLS